MTMFNGPFGNYAAGTYGAVLNALCEQEGRPCSAVSNYVLAGNGRILASHGNDKIVATYVWEDDKITFTWM